MRELACCGVAAPLGALLLAICPAHAGSYALVCKNPVRTYIVTYSDGDSEVLSDADTRQYRNAVIASVESGQVHALVLSTPDPTVTEILHLLPTPKMEVFSSGELFQVDQCTAP
jgi:hypothetical protein